MANEMEWLIEQLGEDRVREILLRQGVDIAKGEDIIEYWERRKEYERIKKEGMDR